MTGRGPGNRRVASMSGGQGAGAASESPRASASRSVVSGVRRASGGLAGRRRALTEAPGDAPIRDGSRSAIALPSRHRRVDPWEGWPSGPALRSLGRGRGTSPTAGPGREGSARTSADVSAGWPRNMPVPGRQGASTSSWRPVRGRASVAGGVVPRLRHAGLDAGVIVLEQRLGGGPEGADLRSVRGVVGPRVPMIDRICEPASSDRSSRATASPSSRGSASIAARCRGAIPGDPGSGGPGRATSLCSAAVRGVARPSSWAGRAGSKGIPGAGLSASIASRSPLAAKAGRRAWNAPSCAARGEARGRAQAATRTLGRRPGNRGVKGVRPRVARRSARGARPRRRRSIRRRRRGSGGGRGRCAGPRRRTAWRGRSAGRPAAGRSVRGPLSSGTVSVRAMSRQVSMSRPGRSLVWHRGAASSRTVPREDSAMRHPAPAPASRVAARQAPAASEQGVVGFDEAEMILWPGQETTTSAPPIAHRARMLGRGRPRPRSRDGGRRRPPRTPSPRRAASPRGRRCRRLRARPRAGATSPTGARAAGPRRSPVRREDAREAKSLISGAEAPFGGQEAAPGQG